MQPTTAAISYTCCDHGWFFVILLIVVHSDMLWHVLAFLADLLKLPLPGSPRSGEPFCCSLCNLPPLPFLIHVGTTGGFSSVFLVLVLICSTWLFWSLNYTCMYYLFKQCHNLETLNSDHTCEIYLPYRPLHSMVGPHIRIVHIIINLLILRPYLAWTFSAQNLDAPPGLDLRPKPKL